MPPRMPNHDPFAPHTAIPLPRTPETGVVAGLELDADVRNMAGQTPPRDPEDPSYDPSDEAYADAYYSTRRYVVDSAARYAAQSPDGFNSTVRDLHSDQQYSETFAEDDPTRLKIERAMLIQAEALVPVAHEAMRADPNMDVNVQECERTVQTIVSRIAAATREHEVKGERLLLVGDATQGTPPLLRELQEYAELGLGPIVAQAIAQGIRDAAAALEKTSGKSSGLEQKTVAADVAARKAEAAAGPATPPAEPSGFRKNLQAAGRAIVTTAAGHSARGITQAKYAERDADTAARAEKYLKSLEADSHATAAVQRRKHGISQFDERKLENAVKNDELALKAMLELRKILIQEPSGDIVTGHKYTAADGTPLRQIIEDLQRAPATRTARGTGDVDPVADAQRYVLREAHNERMDMIAEMAAPDSLALQFARIDRLYRDIEGLDEEISQIPVRSRSEREGLAARLRYSRLVLQRQTMHGLYNQAAAHYGQHSIEQAPNTAAGREFHGRLPMHIIEDGGVLIGDDEYRAIHWQNGDHATLVEDGYRGPGVFEAIVNLRNGTAVNHGRFVRFAPDGQIRGEWPEPRPSANQLQQLDQRRQQTRRLYGYPGPGGYGFIEARDENIDARQNGLFANMELPSEAEEFIDRIDPLTGILLNEARATASDPRLNASLNYGRNRADVEARRAARVSAGVATAEAAAELAILNAQLVTMDQEYSNYTSDPANVARIHQTRANARALNGQRFLTLRAAVYNGRANLLGDGTIVLPQEQPRDLRGAPSLHALLGLPDGTWRFGPTGEAVRVFVPPAKNAPTIRRVFNPDESYVRAA